MWEPDSATNSVAKCHPENADGSERKRQKSPRAELAQQRLLFICCFAGWKLSSWQLPEAGSTSHPVRQDPGQGHGSEEAHKKHMAAMVLFSTGEESQQGKQRYLKALSALSPRTLELCAAAPGAKALSERLLNNIYRAGDNNI